MRTRNWLFTGWLVAASALTAAAQAPPVVPTPPVVPPPPVVPTLTPPPAPVVPPPPVVPAPPTTPAAGPTPSETPGEKPAEPTGPTFEFGLKDDEKNIAPFTHGDAKTEEGKIEVAPDKNTLTITLSGGVGANVWLGVHSEALQTFRLTQEIEVTCTDSSVKEMILTLDSKLIGFVRSKQKASACVRIASITVTPSGSGSPILSVSHPLPCVGGACHYWDPAMGSQSTDPAEAVRSQPLPLGLYIVDVNFVMTATAEGFLNAHSTAIFSPEPTELDPWEREHDPFAGEKKDGYGFTSVLTATTVKAPPVASEKTWKNLKKKLAKLKKEKKEKKEQEEMATQGVPQFATGPLLPQARYMPADAPPTVSR